MNCATISEQKIALQAKKKADAMARAARRAKYDALIQQKHVLCVNGDPSKPITVEEQSECNEKWIIKPQ